MDKLENKKIGLQQRVYLQLINILNQGLNEIKGKEPMKEKKIKNNSKYSKVKTYRLDNGLYFYEIIDNRNTRAGIFLSTLDLSEIIYNHLVQIKLLSQIETESGFISLGNEKEKRTLAVMVQQNGKTMEKITIISPPRNNESWQSQYTQMRINEKNSIRCKTDDTFRDIIRGKSLLKELIFMLKLRNLTNEILDKEYGYFSLVQIKRAFLNFFGKGTRKDAMDDCEKNI